MNAPENFDFLADVPQAMKDARRWLLWRYVPTDSGKPRKVPYYVTGAPRSGATDTPEDIAHLASFADALRAFRPDRYAGLGFALGPDGTGKCWQGIDFDDVPHRPELAELVPDLPGYAETSPSGKGYHAIGYGPDFPTLGSNASGIEAYAHGRFFTVTGEGAGTGEPCDLSGFVARVLAPMHRRTAATAPEAAQAAFVPPEVLRDLRSALTALRADDRVLWVDVGHALKTIGEQGRALWLEWGQTSQKYSAADAARVWDSLRPQNTGYQAVFAKAQAAGWLNPASNAAQAGREAVARLIRDTVEPRRFKLAERTAARLFKGEPPPVNWLVQGIFPLGVTCLLASPPNVGKSFLALELAAKVAGRRDGECPPVAFGALVAAHGRAVYVSAEDDEPEIHRRLHSLCGSDMPDKLHVLSLPDVGHFGIIEPDPVTKEFRATREWSELAEEIRALPDVRLVILDTLQALTSGDTNTTQATQPLMNEATALARATGACVMLIHHVAKGSTKEIRSALDAMEAIRGSGAIAGSARAAYVLWPPADGGRNVCEVLGSEFKEGRVAFGLTAKGYGDARRDRSVFVRNERGILTDRTQAYNALSGGDTDAMRMDLLRAIREAWQRGEAFAASQGSNGLHSRRFELPESFHEKPRQWFEEQAGKLLSEGNIKRLSYRGGARLVPADAETAVPTPPEGATPGAEEAAPEVAE